MTAGDMTTQSDSPYPDCVKKRVSRACDRCRLKKSKVLIPCSRCRADNTICVFGKQKQKAFDKVYPNGYVEILEQQQAWLVQGLQELYHRTAKAEGGLRAQLKPDSQGHWLIQDLLVHLGIFDLSKAEYFEESPDILQRRLWNDNLQPQVSETSSASVLSPVFSPLSSHSCSSICSERSCPVQQNLNPVTNIASRDNSDGNVHREAQDRMCMQGVSNSVNVQSVPQRLSARNDLWLSDEMDLSLIDQIPPSTLVWPPMSMELPQSSEYDQVFKHFVNPDFMDGSFDRDCLTWPEFCL
ncbi:hypothetical protein N7462_007723 [Penicillium macrosclerotiorum]|uniref:uncharacterized protein n=1 Tax=Penicillium macrosclerotiorum TaxID=303699 RepID=UPI0025475656|nr:uncharacterized protein N7462_007723 [Penicillium macrosclerotiorum]KAJ5679479.1 hypothetical protein N7462_007723 [Penicillium macrosclerotiorum]